MMKNLKVNDKVKVEIYGVDGKVIKTRNFDEVFTVVEKDGKLGIYWTEEFTPLESFSWNVKFVIVAENADFEELEKLLDVECKNYDTDCSSCPYGKECERYARLYESNK